MKRRVSGLDAEEVKAMADNLPRRAYQGKGYLAGQRKAPTIAEGIGEALALTNTLKTTRDERIRRAKQCILWLGEHYPAVRTWDQMRPAMIQAYVVDLERRGKAFDTVRLNVAPIKLAWRHMAENHPELVKPLARIKLASAPLREIECLDAGELADLLDWLRAKAPNLWPMACWQGLCGLRMLEATALRAQDVDLKTQTVTVCDTGRHKPKTTASWRTISICGEAVQALKAAMTGQEVRPATGELFTTYAGALWETSSLTHRWAQALRRAARDLDNLRLAKIPARKLRAAFATLASRLGAQDRILKAYLGHSSGDVLGGHYRRIDLDELRTVSDRMNGWREAPSKQDSGNGSGKILATRQASAL